MSNIYNVNATTPRPYIPSSSGTRGSGTTPKSGCGRIGCFTGFMGLGVVAVLIAVVYFFVWPMLFPNDISGDLLDLTYAEGKDGKGYLWVQTNPSFQYISETSTPGSHSVSSECLFCRTETFIIDPETQNVIHKFTTDFDGPPPTPKMFSVDGNVWIVSGNFRDNEPMINVYDAASGDPVMDTKGFISKHPRFSAGISELRYEDKPARLNIKTKDGLDQVYLVGKDTIFKNTSDYNQYTEGIMSGDASIFSLISEEGISERKVLYRITGPAGKVFGSHIPESMLDDASYILRHYNSTAEPITPGTVYLEGEMLYFDDEGAVIIYQDQLGKKAERLLSLIDSEGNIKWTKSTKDGELFEELKLDEEENTFGRMFFLRSHLKGERGDNMFIFKYSGKGIICFDWETGKKIWEMED
ncbi:MAG TPA: hypothetical protein VK004_04115 [Ignavibacteria bacterium]|nr:hypothetical protein [Ignavibacteria bacterium]